jgi:AcrR family transcriptional regulator
VDGRTEGGVIERDVERGLPSAHERLLAATRSLIAERGVDGATTREIAARASVSEVTLFRRFGSKDQLVAQAIAAAMAPFREAVAVEPSGDLVVDLERLARGYADFLQTDPLLALRVLTETMANEDLRDEALPWRRELADGLVACLASHQRSGDLLTEDPGAALAGFLGPILARAALSHIAPTSTPFDPRVHVQRYLYGWHTHDDAR